MPRLAKKQPPNTGNGPFRLSRPCMTLFRSLEYDFFRGALLNISDRLESSRDRMKHAVDA